MSAVDDELDREFDAIYDSMTPQQREDARAAFLDLGGLSCPSAQKSRRGRPLGRTALAIRNAVVDLTGRYERMTVRQVFYALEVQGVVAKTEGGYRQVQTQVLKMRREGLLAWEFITDGTRWMRKPPSSYRLGLVTRDARIGELEPVAARVPELEDSLGNYEYAIDRYLVYATHVTETLDQLQRVVARDIGVDIPEYIVRGILNPARDVLTEFPEEHVRLSVLLPEGDDFVMAWASGHTLTGQTKYRVPRDQTLARIALETGEVQVWDDAAEDDRFTRNPKATYPLHAMISCPLRQGDHVVAVFNCIAAMPNVFDDAERSYVESLGGVLSVAVNVWLDRQGAVPDAGEIVGRA